MANYNCSIRTNYFHVKDAEKFREFMNHVLGSEDNIDLWEKTDNSATPCSDSDATVLSSDT